MTSAPTATSSKKSTRPSSKSSGCRRSSSPGTVETCCTWRRSNFPTCGVVVMLTLPFSIEWSMSWRRAATSSCSTMSRYARTRSGARIGFDVIEGEATRFLWRSESLKHGRAVEVGDDRFEVRQPPKNASGGNDGDDDPPAQVVVTIVSSPRCRKPARAARGHPGSAEATRFRPDKGPHLSPHLERVGTAGHEELRCCKLPRRHEKACGFDGYR